MTPHTRIDHIAALSASVANLSNAREAGAGLQNEMLSSAQKLLCQRIEELANTPLMSAPAAVPAGPAVDAERADIELFLWLRAQGFEILGVALEFLTPEGHLSEREMVLKAFNEFCELRKQHLQQQAAENSAQSEHNTQRRLTTDSFRHQEAAKTRAMGAVDAMIRSDLEALS